eukprot:COSAG02_NODE_2725_length_8156_cov_3.067271_4_plen_113_part_00
MGSGQASTSPRTAWKLAWPSARSVCRVATDASSASRRPPLSARAVTVASIASRRAFTLVTTASTCGGGGDKKQSTSSPRHATPAGVNECVRPTWSGTEIRVFGPSVFADEFH